jgi:hypothetical protein
MTKTLLFYFLCKYQGQGDESVYGKLSLDLVERLHLEEFRQQ